MSGILDKKSRILDFVITQNGRSQIESGDIRYKYASVSDKSVIYTKDHDLSKTKKSNVSNSDITYIPIEVSSKISDSINPELSVRDFYLDNDNINVYQAIDQNESINFIDAVDNYLVTFSLTRHLKELKYLTSKSLINKDKDFVFIDNGLVNNKIDFVNIDKINKYPTIRKIETNALNLPAISSDKRFSHKRNFLKLIPINKNSEELYSEDNFTNMEKIKEENKIGFLFPTLKADIDFSDTEPREKEITKIIDFLNDTTNIFKKVYQLKDPSEKNTLIFEMHELNDGNESIKKLKILKIGEFYDKSTFKKVYLAGKIIRSKNLNEEEAEENLFSFNNGIVNLKNKKEVIFSNYFSFVTLFTIIIE